MISGTAEWRALTAHVEAMAGVHLRDLFAADPGRFDTFSLREDALLADFSKQRVTAETMRLLLALAGQADLEGWIARLFAGEPVNSTEGRAAMHMALRHSGPEAMHVEGRDVMPEIRAERERMESFVSEVRAGKRRGAHGHRIRDVVNIGIGGSDLGPAMAVEALAPLSRRNLSCHFVSNVDPAQLNRTLYRLKPERTLFIVTSKAFTTQETMANAAAARRWLTEALGEGAVANHFVGVSAATDKMDAFEIVPENRFTLWDWVGGRYSLWSAVGLSLALVIGNRGFRRLLAGAERMDKHFRTASLERNMPVVMGLIGLWNANFLGAETLAVVPYAQQLARLPAYLQQLEMESNGKRVSRDGTPVAHATAPVIWGEPGTNGQHAFFQMLHQGTRPVPVDFIVAASAPEAYQEGHRLLLANCLAQSTALMRGRTGAEVAEALRRDGVPEAEIASKVGHMIHPGNRLSTTLMLRCLNPYGLGMLLALYEHKVFVQGVLWEILSFDQWGVEFGKKLVDDVLRQLDGAGKDGGKDMVDSSMQGLLAQYTQWR